MNPPLLEVRNLSVRYGRAALAVDGLSLTLRRGEFHALLGRNGAGKTSSLRGIVGFERHENVTVTGGVLVGGVECYRRSPLRMLRRGVAMVSERDKVFGQLTVLDQIRLVGGHKGWETATGHFPELEPLGSRLAAFLSGGERQMLSIALSLVKRPSALLIDELSLGLAPVVVERLMHNLRTIADEEGLGVLLVDQAASTAIAVSDHVHLIGDGKIIDSGPADRVELNDIYESYVGTAEVHR